MFTTLANYNPKSPGLLGPIPYWGGCLHDERLDIDTQVWIDFHALVMSGSVVVIFHQSAAGPAAIGKWLNYTRATQTMPELWWASAYRTREKDSLAAVRIDNPRFRVAGIAAIVARLETPRETPRAESSDGYNGTPDGADSYFAEGRAAISYWCEQGSPPRKQLEFSTPPQNIAIIRQIWGPDARPNHKPAFPLTLAAECSP